MTMSFFLPSDAGEVSPSYGDGGVMGASEKLDPSARFAGSSPRETRGGWAS
jgi:hypothetical protein